MVKKSILVLLCLGVLFVSSLVAQLPVVIGVRYLEWDYYDTDLVEEFKMYCQSTPGVIIGTPTLKASIASPTLEWAITLPDGIWYCVVTAAVPSQSLESVPSNEIGFEVKSFDPSRPPDALGMKPIS
jgi:hypothetical protein